MGLRSAIRKIKNEAVEHAENVAGAAKKRFDGLVVRLDDLYETEAEKAEQQERSDLQDKVYDLEEQIKVNQARHDALAHEYEATASRLREQRRWAWSAATLFAATTAAALILHFG